MAMSMPMKLRRSQARLARLEQIASDRRLSAAQQRALNHLAHSQRAALRLRVMALGYHGMRAPRH
jgi:hypothetical protein